MERKYYTCEQILEALSEVGVGAGDISEVLSCLGRMPSAESDIIRCKDCKWKQGSVCVRFADVYPFADDFCSRAERKEDE